MVHPNILHLLSQTHSSRSCLHCSPPLSSSLSLDFSSVLRWTLFFTPYSLRQHWNGFILGASTLSGDAELPSTRLRAVRLRAFRSSRSPHKRNSFSRRVSSATGDLRRLGTYERGHHFSPLLSRERRATRKGKNSLLCFELQ